MSEDTAISLFMYAQCMEKLGKPLDPWQGKNILEAYKIEHSINPHRICKVCGK